VGADQPGDRERAMTIARGSTDLDTTVEERPFRAASSGKEEGWALAAAGRALYFVLIGTACFAMTCAVGLVVPRAQAGPTDCSYVRKSELVGKPAEMIWQNSSISVEGKFSHMDSANSYRLTPSDLKMPTGNYFRAAVEGAAYFQPTTNASTTTGPLQFQNLRKEWIESHEFVCRLPMKAPAPTNN
jgi:hypothetical protein